MLRPVPIGLLASLRGRNGASARPAAAWVPHRARCSTASTFGPSLALVSQNMQLWAWGWQRVSVGPCLHQEPCGAAAHHGRLPVVCVDALGQATGPSCCPQASVAVTARCLAGQRGDTGPLWGWQPMATLAVVSLGAKCGSRPDRNTRKRENVGGSTLTFPLGFPLTRCEGAPGLSPRWAV